MFGIFCLCHTANRFNVSSQIVGVNCFMESLGIQTFSTTRGIQMHSNSMESILVVNITKKLSRILIAFSYHYIVHNGSKKI